MSASKKEEGLVDVEFDCWSLCGKDSSFIIKMSSPPRVGDCIEIHKSWFPDHYDDDWVFDEQPNGYRRVWISIVLHRIPKSGKPRRIKVCFESSPEDLLDYLQGKIAYCEQLKEKQNYKTFALFRDNGETISVRQLLK